MKMGTARKVHTDIWNNSNGLGGLTPQEKYFYLYLLTNPNTNRIGIYRITKRQIAFDIDYSIETVNLLMKRFIEHHKAIRYNPETRELAIKNWGNNNLQKSRKSVMDGLYAELKEVLDVSLILYVSESIQHEEIYSLVNHGDGSRASFG